MTEEQKELLKEKLKLFFDKKLDSLTTKFENDIKLIEEFKYNTYDNIIIPYRQLSLKEEEEKQKNNHIEANKEIKKEDKKIEQKKKEDKKVEEKKKPEIKKKEEHKEAKEHKETKEPKKKEEHKETKDNSSKTTKNENLNLTKTPMKSNRKKELDFKGKTEALPKKSRVFSSKAPHKPELNTTTIATERNKKKPTPSLTESTRRKSAEKNRSTKTPFNKKDKEDNEDSKTKKAKAISQTAYKPTATKRFTNAKKPIEKKGKGKPDKKKIEKKKETKPVNKKEEKKEEKPEIKKEEKKIVLNDKSIHKIPDDLKSNSSLYSIYLMIKGNYLNNKEKYKLILTSPKIYKNFGNDVKFLLNDKKSELKSKIDELETFLKKYDDLPNIVSTTFQLSTSALKSLMFLTKEEMENLAKKGNLSKEFSDLFKIILYILDIKLDENLQNEDLLQFLVSELFLKTNKKNLMLVISEYLSNNKELNLTQEKIDKIENIIKSNEVILSITEMAKKNRIISYSTFLIKEFHEFINKKTSDGIFYYELKNKNNLLKEYKYKLATIENNGVPPKIEEEKMEEKKDAIEEKKEIKEEPNKEEIKQENNEKIEDNQELIKENKEEGQENKNNEKEEIKIEKKEDNNSPIENQKVEEQNVKNE